MQRRLLYLLLLLALLVFVGDVSAHKPIWTRGEQVEIPDLTTSFAVYQELNRPDEVDVYFFEGSAGETIRGEVNVPKIDRLADFGVALALFGPGLPDAEHETLPPDHPEDLGALVFASEKTEDFFEPFTQTSYWGRQEFEVSLPQDGTYYLLIWNPENDTGKYVLATGSAERFSPSDLFRFPIWWIQVHIFFEHTLYLVAAASGLILAFALAVVGKRRATSDRSARTRPARV